MCEPTLWDLELAGTPVSGYVMIMKITIRSSLTELLFLILQVSLYVACGLKQYHTANADNAADKVEP